MSFVNLEENIDLFIHLAIIAIQDQLSDSLVHGGLVFLMVHHSIILIVALLTWNIKYLILLTLNENGIFCMLVSYPGPEEQLNDLIQTHLRGLRCLLCLRCSTWLFILPRADVFCFQNVDFEG